MQYPMQRNTDEAQAGSIFHSFGTEAVSGMGEPGSRPGWHFFNNTRGVGDRIVQYTNESSK